jgi:hypothetical protein
MKEKALQILLVEDNAGDARVLREKFGTEKPGSFVDAAEGAASTQEITLSFDLSFHSKSYEHETERK